jgi:hypothetical protein
MVAARAHGIICAMVPPHSRSYTACEQAEIACSGCGALADMVPRLCTHLVRCHANLVQLLAELWAVIIEVVDQIVHRGVAALQWPKKAETVTTSRPTVPVKCCHDVQLSFDLFATALGQAT